VGYLTAGTKLLPVASCPACFFRYCVPNPAIPEPVGHPGGENGGGDAGRRACRTGAGETD
jgi:hypothetical protein